MSEWLMRDHFQHLHFCVEHKHCACSRNSSQEWQNRRRLKHTHLNTPRCQHHRHNFFKKNSSKSKFLFLYPKCKPWTLFFLSLNTKTLNLLPSFMLTLHSLNKALSLSLYCSFLTRTRQELYLKDLLSEVPERPRMGHTSEPWPLPWIQAIFYENILCKSLH
jgi:hypothetical protein